MFDWIKNLRRRRPVRVIIYGLQSPDWMVALAPDSPVWEGMTDVQEVLQIAETSADLPLQKCPNLRTVVIPLLEDHIERRPRGCPALVPDSLALQTLRDKAAFAQYAHASGLGERCPKTYHLLEAAEFPCVIKRTNLNGGDGVEIVDSLEQARLRLAQKPFGKRPYLIQELVRHSGEYVAHCVCKKGRVLWHCVYQFPATEQPTIRVPEMTSRPHRSIAPPSLVEDLEAFLKPLAFSGPCNVDFTYRADGRIVIFEINPRLGGSMMCAENVADLRSALGCILRHAR